MFKDMLTFTDPVLKICTLDGQSLLIKILVTSLIKNYNFVKVYLFEFNVETRHYFLVPLIH